MKALILVAVVLLSACVSQQASKQEVQEVSFKTDDGFTIYGTLYKNSSSGIILLHMLGRDRTSWKDFAEKLAENYTVLAIDLRGHEKSTTINNEQKQWQAFTTEDFNNIVLDVKAAREFLVSQNVSEITIIGASIGANIALKYVADDKDTRAVVLLSPGYDYRGVNITETIKTYDRPVLLAASSEDIYSADTAKYLYFFAAGRKNMVIYDNAGHGTDMLGKTNLTEVIVSWISSI